MTTTDGISLNVAISGLLFAALSLLIAAYIQARNKSEGTDWSLANFLHDVSWGVLILLIGKTIAIALRFIDHFEFEVTTDKDAIANFVTGLVSIGIIIPSFFPCF